MKNLLSFSLKYSDLLFLHCCNSLKYFKNTKIDASKNQAYIFLAADYGNLGDVAITYAQTRFLEKNSNYQVIEIPISQSLEGLWFVKKHIKPGDLVTTVGGGNMGDLYEQIEFIRQLTFKFFPDNNMLSFPQTFDFSTKNTRALSVAQKVYNHHKNLFLIAREKTSFELMKKHFHKAKVLLTPDIVLSLNKTSADQKREGVVFCLRQDLEKSLTPQQEEFFIQIAKKHFEKTSVYDTHNGKNKMSIKEREQDLEAIWNAFRSAELVITDRLHGMIFCYITGTPCLAFQNNNHKVRETHDWIKEAGYIHLISEFSEEKILDYFSKEKYKNPAPYISLEKKYQPLLEILA